MSGKGKKQFGVWMDSHYATIVGKENVDSGEFVILGHAKNEGAPPNTNENTANNHEQALMHKFFKEIAAQMQNAEQIHVTGTGTAQEQFQKYMAETPQFRNTSTEESTSNKMSEEKLIEFISGKFN